MNDLIKRNIEFSNTVELHKDNPMTDGKVTWPYIQKTILFLEEEMDETYDAYFKKDRVELLDGALDVAVVALNLAYKLFRLYEFTHEEAELKVLESFNEVIESNMSKRSPDGSVSFDRNGKVKKPETFKPVSLDKYFTRSK